MTNPFIYDTYKDSVGNFRSLIIEILQFVLFVGVFLVVCYLFVITPNRVDGESMYPTLKDDDLLFSNRVIQLLGGSVLPGYNYRRGDIVIFQLPDRESYIKRVVGLPGDEVMIKSGSVFINGTKYNEEEYLSEDSFTRVMTSFLPEGVSLEVPKDSYFVLGDNRNFSKDSRYGDIGFINRRYIKGKVLFRIYPFATREFLI